MTKELTLIGEDHTKSSAAELASQKLDGVHVLFVEFPVGNEDFRQIWIENKEVTSAAEGFIKDFKINSLAAKTILEYYNKGQFSILRNLSQTNKSNIISFMQRKLGQSYEKDSIEIMFNSVLEQLKASVETNIPEMCVGIIAHRAATIALAEKCIEKNIPIVAVDIPIDVTQDTKLSEELFSTLDKRDGIMSDRIYQVLQKDGVSKGLMVCGDFHVTGIQKKISSKGVKVNAIILDKVETLIRSSKPSKLPAPAKHVKS